jgi:two-component system chemotaxis response regulator CheB
LPENLSAPDLIVQHKPQGYTAALADRLTLKSRRPVAEGRAGALLEPGQVWIAPGGYHLTVCRSGHAKLLDVHRGSREHGCRPSVDVLFRATADQYGPHVLGVVLSGHTLDGVQGSRHIRDAGGQILIQDEQSALVWEAPGAVAQAQLAEKMLAPEVLAKEITRRVQAGRGDAMSPATLVRGRESLARQEPALFHPGMTYSE